MYNYYIMKSLYASCPLLSVPPNSVTVIITTSGSATAGQEYTLQCEVSSIPGLTNTPTATWFHQNGSHITSSGGITISPRTPSPSSSLAFTTLTTFHGGGYTCEGRVESPALDSPETVSKTQHVTVQSKLLYIQTCKFTMICTVTVMSGEITQSCLK